MMKTKIKPSFKEERKLWKANIDFVIGLDEVGRGAFAGPIVAAGVIFKPNFKHPFLKHVNDSKILNYKQREEMSVFIRERSVFAIESIDINYINKYGIGRANSAVFRKVLRKLLLGLSDSNYYVLIDGFHKKYLLGGLQKQKAIVKGDRKSISIAAASIIAKVHRDNLMRKAGKEYPNYMFARNKGYGTRLHRDAIAQFGLCDLHRTSFKLNKFL